MKSQLSYVLLVSVLITTAISPLFAKELFFCRVVDNKGVEHRLAEAHLCYSYRDDKRWMGFDCQIGDSKFSLRFNKIRRIDFIGKEGDPIGGATLANVLLTNGQTRKMYIRPTNGDFGIGGNSEDIGSHVHVRLGKVKTIEFLHDGTFVKCTLCSTIFYNFELGVCPFDGGNLSYVTAKHQSVHSPRICPKCKTTWPHTYQFCPYHGTETEASSLPAPAIKSASQAQADHMAHAKSDSLMEAVLNVSLARSGVDPTSKEAKKAKEFGKLWMSPLSDPKEIQNRLEELRQDFLKKSSTQRDK